MGSRRDPQGRMTGPAVFNLPLWFIEGMAEYLSLGPVDANTAMWIRDASARNKMPSVDKLDDPSFFPYRYGEAFWAFIAGRWGDRAVGDMLRATGPQGDVEQAMKVVLGLDKKTFTQEWHDATRRTYAPIVETTRKPDAFGRLLVSKAHSGGDMNVTPSVSPDGKRVVFLSEKDLFSIDMYVADVATGTVQRRLVKTAGDPHFDSLQFISSAGDWAPDNRRFVFAAISGGSPVLTIVDVDSGGREREQKFTALGEIYNPAWSPDGKQIAFSALTGGVLDLFVWNVETGALRQLTTDAYADLDPEWSPDGRQIAFVTDRFSSDIAALAFGNYRIGVMDVESKQIRPLAGFSSGRNINPEFTADGRSLYFVAAPDGIANVYRTELASGTTAKVTNVLSGISGITPLTPSISVAAAAPTVVFTVFEDNDYNLYATTTGTQLTGREAAPGDRDAAALPPFNRRTSEVAAYLGAPATGLPPVREYPQTPYRAKLSLDQVGQVAAGVGTDQFGTYGVGGISLMWSDMLNNHLLATQIQATSRFDEFGAVVQYLNREHRWNWGIVGQQLPYVTGGFAQGTAIVDGSPAFVQQEQRIIQTDRAGVGLVQYPFSKAQRVEFSAGARQIAFSQKLETQVFSQTGVLIDDRSEDLPAPSALTLGTASTALVYDTSIFGATSPINGQRYRLEYTQNSGSLNFGEVLLDYRRYLYVGRPFTLALRGMHYGRYGSGSEDPRLSPLFLGYPGLVRGYEVQSFDASECPADATQSCPAFDQLLGSRMAVGNAELRFPLLGLFTRSGRNYYGAFPVEMALFADAGRAWSTRDVTFFSGTGTALQATSLSGSRDWARSAGAAVRVNAFGYAILELDYVRPFDRPNRGWLWQFNLIPGF